MGPWIVSGCAFVPLAALMAVAGLGRRRTRALRRGGPVPERPPTSGERTTSRTTHLAWMAGLALAAWALDPAVGPARATRLPLAAGALFVCATGWAGRVRSVALVPGSLVVRRRVGRPSSVRSAGCTRLLPPRTPLGAWRIRSDGAVLALMPSDLLGLEDLLWSLVRSSGLRFDGRGWSTSPNPP